MIPHLSLRKQLAIAVLLACVSLIVRVPFLLRSEAFFDSDEAVEGLMARHVVQGEFETFYWGQSYKGVLETYPMAAALVMFGSSVAVLKGVTAVLFALYVGASFVLFERWFGWRVALASSLVTVVGPPALLYWTLSANADYVLTMLFGTGLLLLVPAPRENVSKGRLVAFGVVAGLGAWNHPLIACYLLPLGLLGFLGSEWWRSNRSLRLVRTVILGRSEGRWRPLVLLFNAAALVYAGLSVAAFLTGGIDVSVWGLPIAAHNPQKMAGVALLCGLFTITTVALTEFRDVVTRLWRQARPAVAGFLVGYAPVLIHALKGGRVGAPLRHMDLAQFLRAAPAMVHDIPATLAGFVSPAADERLPVPVALSVPIGLALAVYLWDSRQRLLEVVTVKANASSLRDGFFPVFLPLFAVLFVASGVYLDVHSYRYLIPAFAAIPLALTLGCRSAGRWGTWVSVLLFLAILGTFGVQEVLWFRTLTVDPCERRTIACLRALGVRGGRADYWISYKMTFLADEEIVIAPEGDLDRYPPYSRLVAGLDRVAYLRRPQDKTPGLGTPQCQCGSLNAFIRDDRR